MTSDMAGGALAHASALAGTPGAAAAVVASAVQTATEPAMERIREARLKGYEGDACGTCGNFTLVRNGTCLKCVTCGETSGCS